MQSRLSAGCSFAYCNFHLCMGFEYGRDIHSEQSSAIARHSLKLTGIPLHFRAFFKVRPHVISGHPFVLECATQPVSNCRGARVIGIRATWPSQQIESAGRALQPRNHRCFIWVVIRIELATVPPPAHSKLVRYRQIAS